MTKKRWTLEFSDEDWLVVELNVVRGKVKGFVLNYVAHVGDRIREVVRYDTDHGHLHLHRFWMDERRQTLDLEDRERPSDDYGGVFSTAAADLRANWSQYRGRLKERLHDQGGKHET